VLLALVGMWRWSAWRGLDARLDDGSSSQEQRASPTADADSTGTPEGANGVEQTIIGRWERLDSRGKKEVFEFATGSDFRFVRDGHVGPPGSYRFIDADTVSVRFNFFYTMRAKVRVTGDELIVKVLARDQDEERVFRRVGPPIHAGGER
jgi:hypothetical protein